MQGPEPFHRFTVSITNYLSPENASKQTIYNLQNKTKNKLAMHSPILVIRISMFESNENFTSTTIILYN